MGRGTKNKYTTTSRREKKPKIQFSKDMCLRSWWLMAISVFVCIGGEFFLQFTYRGSMREIVTVVLSLITFVTVFINGGYITQNIFRDTSLNKYGIHVHEEEGHKHFMDKAGGEGSDRAVG
jgi:hypothetical protein